MVTLRREEPGDPPQLRIEIGPDCMTVRTLARHREPAADVTRYQGTFTLRGRSMAMILIVNCGAPQPYLELRREQSTEDRVTVPITHEQQDRILALADPLSEVCPW